PYHSSSRSRSWKSIRRRHAHAGRKLFLAVKWFVRSPRLPGEQPAITRIGAMEAYSRQRGSLTEVMLPMAWKWLRAGTSAKSGVPRPAPAPRGGEGTALRSGARREVAQASQLALSAGAQVGESFQRAATSTGR